MTVRKYEEKDLTAMIQIWNEVVESNIHARPKVKAPDKSPDPYFQRH